MEPGFQADLRQRFCKFRQNLLNDSAKYFVVIVGETVKYKPLAEVPNIDPPVEESHHLIILPVETALRLLLCPKHVFAGEAVKFVGGEGFWELAIC